MSKTFTLGALLTVTTGRFLLDDIGDLYNILNYMTGDDLMTHQLPRASKECSPEIIRQHPQLGDVVVPQSLKSRETCIAWLDSVAPKLGSEFVLEPMPIEDHTYIDPLAELSIMAPHVPVIAVIHPDSRNT